MIGEVGGMDRRLLIAALVVPLALLGPTQALASGGEGDKTKSSGPYLPIKTLLGTTLHANGARGVLSVDCGLDVPDPALCTRADQSIPRLRAAYLQIVQSYAASLSPGSLPSADYLSQALQRQTDVTLGRPGAKLLLGAIIAN